MAGSRYCLTKLKGNFLLHSIIIVLAWFFLLTTVLLAGILLFTNKQTTPSRSSDRIIQRNLVPPSVLERYQGVITQWDGQWFITIAKGGYYFMENGYSSAPFLPLFPLLIKALQPVFGSWAWAGLTINVLSLIGAGYYLLKLAEQEQMTRKQGNAAFCMLLLYPMAFFLTSLYSEPLFLLFSISSFYHMKQKKWFWAGVLGACAAATRIPGVFLVFPLMYYLWKDGAPLIRYGYSLIIAFGTTAYLGMLQRYTGNPFSFLSAHQHWGRHFLRIDQGQFNWSDPERIIRGGTEIMFTLLLLVGLGYVYRKLDRGYFWFCLFTLMVPLATGTLMSANRFGLVLFPIFLALAKDERSCARQVYLWVAPALLVFYSLVYVSGFFIG